jgi:hypothetical protein
MPGRGSVARRFHEEVGMARTKRLASGLLGLMSVVMASVVWAGAQPGPPPQPEQPAPAGMPKFEIDRQVQDWGKVTDLDQLRAEVNFKNTGTAPLVFLELKPSCSCVRPKLRGAKRTYQPGESGVIDLGFEPLGKRGPTSYTVSIRTNDPSNAALTLEVKCDVSATVFADPADGVNMGQVDQGKSKEMTFTVSGRAEDFRATFASVSGAGYLSAKVGETKEVEINGEKIRQTSVTVTLNGKAPVGKFSEKIFVRHTDARLAMQTVSVSGEVLPDVRPEVTMLDMGEVAEGADFSGEFKVFSVSGKKFNVTKTTYSSRTAFGSPLSVDVTATPNESGDMYTIRVSGKGPKIGGLYTGDVVVVTEGASRTTVRVRAKFISKGEQQPEPKTEGKQP